MAESGRRRYGSSDTTSNDPLIAHWVLSSVLSAGVFFASIYTQSSLHSLERKNVRLQMIGRVSEISFLLIALFLWPWMNVMLNAAGMDDEIPCILLLLWSQILGSFIATLLMYRSCTFAWRAARAERTKFYIKYGSSSLKYLDQNDRRRLQVAGWVRRYLNPKCRKITALVCFLIFAGPIMFADAGNIAWVQGRRKYCAPTPGGYAILLWYIWAVPFTIFLQRCEILDPFGIKQKLQVQTSCCTVLFVGYMVTIYEEPRYGTSHLGLLVWNLIMLVMWMFWYTESYQPLMRTRKRIEECKSPNTTSTLPLSETLASPDLLQLFQEHLVEEWAMENLDFYQEVVFFDVMSINTLRRCEEAKKRMGTDSKVPENRESRITELVKALALKAIRIYVVYIEEGAKHQVNLSARTASSLHEFFSNSQIANWRVIATKTFTQFDVSEMASSTERSKSLFKGTSAPFVLKSGHSAIETPGGKPSAMDIGTMNPIDGKQSSPTTPRQFFGVSVGSLQSPADNKSITNDETPPHSEGEASTGTAHKVAPVKISIRSDLSQTPDFDSKKGIELQTHSRGDFGEPPGFKPVATSYAEKKLLRKATLRLKNNNKFCKVVRTAASVRIQSTDLRFSAALMSDTKDPSVALLQKLIIIFDEAKAEIFLLMKDTHVRFSQKASVRSLAAHQEARVR
eukprot:CAMPEP_0167759858 /NCGR_PEP_ID=MMETSP0110_2-20121227/11256_1 /TAXON_ID=629695 /ORGANISM="Gymnochlora sp., Strain CCMP2014" /LENGTH=680 /DNA_ID=CAMNT_0007646289 /DNA_START=61 /DNA_END=2103 /DNA_ORIENTATION=+